MAPIESLVKLQPWFPSLRWEEHSDDDDDVDDDEYLISISGASANTRHNY